MSTINVGLIGAGTVGCGVYKILTENQDVIAKRLGSKVAIKRVADIDIERRRPVDIPRSLFTTDAMELIRDDSIHIIIELIGGVTAARDYVLGAIKNKKHVVTANKALLAHHGMEIFRMALENGVNVGFEASVGGGIPIIKAIREGLIANRIESIHGIVNGTTNYILTKMTEEGRTFEDVLAQAQEEGYAEADPSYDIDGIDAAHKISILAMLSYGTYFDFESIPAQGIRHITPIDVSFADEFGYKIKLLAIAKSLEGGIQLSVYPALVEAGTPLADVSGAFNAIHIVGDAVGPTMLYGMGAGMMPTASAVASDIVDISRNILFNKANSNVPVIHERHAGLRLIHTSELLSRFYLRFQVEDRPGVLGQIAGILGNHNISIESVIQKGRHIGGGEVPVVIMTHEVFEKDLLMALGEISKLGICKENPIFIRIAEL